MLKWILSALVAIAVVIALIKYVDSDVIAAAFYRANWFYLLIAFLSVIILKLLEILQFTLMASQSSRISFFEAIRLYIAGQPPTVLPGGVLFRAAMLRQEFNTSAPVAATVVTIQRGYYVVVLTIAAVIGALYFKRQEYGVLLAAAVVSLLVVILYIRTTRIAIINWLSKLSFARNLRDHIDEVRTSLSFLFSPVVVSFGLALSVVILAADVACLGFSGLAFNVQPEPLNWLLVLAFPSLLGRLSGLPLGIGVMDATMVGALTLGVSISVESAVLVVAAYRIIRYLLPISVGAFVYFFLWLPRHRR